MRVVGLAALVAAGVLACGFLAQWTALPRAAAGDVAAARAALWLSRYREVKSELAIGHRVVDATCVHGWIDGPHDLDRRGTLLSLGDGATIRDLPPHTLLFHRVSPGHAVALLETAGCTKVLAARLAELAQFDGGIQAHRLMFDGQPALAVRFPHLTLYVNRRTDLPLAVRSGRLHSRLRLVPQRSAA
jgi:hypothetical protein